MMYVLISIDNTSQMQFYGPFPSEERARQYAEKADKDFNRQMRWTIKPLIVPYLALVKFR